MVAAVDGTMWDQPRPAAGQPSSFLRASWSPRPLEDVASVRRHLAESSWLFAGLLLTEDLASTSGVAAAVDLGPHDAADHLRGCIDCDVPELEVHRWARGGRDS